MDPNLITVAFAFGFLARQVGLPPLGGGNRREKQKTREEFEKQNRILTPKKEEQR